VLQGYDVVWKYPLEHYMAKKLTVLTQISDPATLINCHARLQAK
jgi:hypothetical protein